MAKKKRRKGKARRMGPKRSLPSAVKAHVKRGLVAVRAAKARLEMSAPGARKAWGELHHVESRLSRMA